jgi:hypothetical protein
MPTDDDEDPRVPILCPECDTTSRIPLADVGEAVERHNEQQHDGRDVAHVDPDVADHLADLIATELGLLDETE